MVSCLLIPVSIFFLLNITHYSRSYSIGKIDTYIDFVSVDGHLYSIASQEKFWSWITK
ncbi:MAG: hypothetical protein RLY35_1267 [Bacteroidota bacterium]|jgi:hypothetical protein